MIKPGEWTFKQAIKAKLDSGETFTIHVTTLYGWTHEYNLVVLGADCMEVSELGKYEPIFIRYDAIAMVRIEDC